MHVGGVTEKRFVKMNIFLSQTCERGETRYDTPPGNQVGEKNISCTHNVSTPCRIVHSSHTDYCISQLYLHRPRNETRVRDVSYSHRYRVLTHSITHVVFAVPAAGAPDDTPINDSS